MSTQHRGFASMPTAKQRELASRGGKACHQKGVGHEWTVEEAREAGRKGGQTAARNREARMIAKAAAAGASVPS